MLFRSERDAGNHADAEYALSTLLSMNPSDELARLALEFLVMDSTKLEDPRRASYAQDRFDRAAEAERRLQYSRAMNEYRRGLSLDPYANQGRKRYAELLRLAGLPSSYLAELGFLASIGKVDQLVSDALEIYESILDGGLARTWNLSPLNLPGRPYSIAIFPLAVNGTPFHSGADIVVARYLRDLFSYSPHIAPMPGVPRVDSPADAFRIARESGSDYYIILRAVETQREFLVSAELRVSRTGALAARIEAPRSGNDRVSLACERIAAEVIASLPIRAELLKRKADIGIINAGKLSGLAVGDAFLVVRNGAIRLKANGPGLEWEEKDVVGTFTVTRVEDELSEGTIKRNGFFDRINPKDHIVRAVPGAGPSQEGQKTGGTVASVETSPGFWIALFERVRSLY